MEKAGRVSREPLIRWAQENLPPENELRDAILAGPPTATRIELNVELEVSSRMLDAKVKRITGNYVS
jgi:hypothetical protein